MSAQPSSKHTCRCEKPTQGAILAERIRPFASTHKSSLKPELRARGRNDGKLSGWLGPCATRSKLHQAGCRRAATASLALNWYTTMAMLVLHRSCSGSTTTTPCQHSSKSVGPECPL